jgi:hypothetical protein
MYEWWPCLQIWLKVELKQRSLKKHCAWSYLVTHTSHDIYILIFQFGVSKKTSSHSSKTILSIYEWITWLSIQVTMYLYYLKSTKVFRFLLTSVSLRPSSTIDNFSLTRYPIRYPGNYWAWCRGPLKLPSNSPRITSTNHAWLLPG